jgi:hypothetical protein
MAVRDFAPEEAVDLGALVELVPAAKARSPRRGSAAAAWYFLAPKAGGTEVELDGMEVTVITPQSPLGRELMGKRRGDRVAIGQGPTAAEFSVARVS